MPNTRVFMTPPSPSPAHRSPSALRPEAAKGVGAQLERLGQDDAGTQRIDRTAGVPHRPGSYVNSERVGAGREGIGELNDVVVDEQEIPLVQRRQRGTYIAWRLGGERLLDVIDRERTAAIQELLPYLM